MIQGKPFTFEVNSGAPFSVMPWKVFGGMRKNFLPFKPTSIKLNSFTEHPIEVMDITQVQVSVKDYSSLSLLIVGQGNVNLAGRNWIYPLQLLTIFKSSNPSLSTNNMPNSGHSTGFSPQKGRKGTIFI